jgi:hypothetical protein
MTSNKIKLLMEGKFYAEGTFDELSKSESEAIADAAAKGADRGGIYISGGALLLIIILLILL